MNVLCLMPYLGGLWASPGAVWCWASFLWPVPALLFRILGSCFQLILCGICTQLLSCIIQAFSTVLNFSHQILGKGDVQVDCLVSVSCAWRLSFWWADCRLEITSEPQFWVLCDTMPFSERLSHVASVIKLGCRGSKSFVCKPCRCSWTSAGFVQWEENNSQNNFGILSRSLERSAR